MGPLEGSGGGRGGRGGFSTTGVGVDGNVATVRKVTIKQV
jgi:hypothetical protein